MATRGVFGILENGKLKSFFKTGAFLPSFLEETVELYREVSPEFDFSELKIFDNKKEEESEKDYRLRSLTDLEESNFLKDYSEDVHFNTVDISPLLDRVNAKNSFGLSIPDASFRPLDSLFIELVVILNLDSKTVDIYKGSVFDFYPELKASQDGDHFKDLAMKFDQRQNIFLEMYSEHFNDFKNANSQFKKMSVEEKRELITKDNKAMLYLYTQARLFDRGPVMKLASINFSVIEQSMFDDGVSVVKSYTCFHRLGECLEQYFYYHKSKLDACENDFNEENHSLVTSLFDFMKKGNAITISI